MFKEKPYRPDDAYFIKKTQPKASGVHGLGIYSTHPIKNKEIFEVSPVLLFSPAVFNIFSEQAETRHIQENYVFFWDHGQVALAWGYTSLYNHGNGDKANAGYRLRRTEAPGIEVYATRDIEVGEEIFLHYMHHKFDIEFAETGDWWSASDNDMTMSIHGFDESTAALMSDAKKNYR